MKSNSLNKKIVRLRSKTAPKNVGIPRNPHTLLAHGKTNSNALYYILRCSNTNSIRLTDQRIVVDNSLVALRAHGDDMDGDLGKLL